MTAPTCNPTTLKTVYLGTPGAMVKLQTPNAGYSSPLDRASVLHPLLGGGNAVTKRRKSRRVYNIAFDGLIDELLDPILSFYTGLNGLGPFTLIDPAWRNQSSQDVSTFGQQQSAITNWAVRAGDTVPVFDATVAPFQESSGVLRWDSPVNTHSLIESVAQTASAITVDPNNATVLLQDQPYFWSCYARVASGTCTVTPAIYAPTPSGTFGSTGGGTQTLTTSWQRISAHFAAGTFPTSIYVAGGLICTQASAPSIYLSDSQMQIGVSSKPDNWVSGIGQPRMYVADVLGNAIDVFWRSDNSLVLVEK